MTLPYNQVIFANQTGNIPLSELDSNFANVASYVETAGTVTASAQPNIRSVGTLTGLTVVGTVTATGFGGTSLSITGNITGGNLNTSGIVRSNGVSVNGNLTVSTTVTAQGNVTGQYILGNGYYLTGISSGSSNYSNANVAAYLPTYTGNLTAGNITITGTYRGNGAGITNIPGSSITGTVVNASYAATAGTVTATSLPNLSTIGTLNSLTVNGRISAGSVTSAGNISGAYILGDGSKLTNLPSSGNSNYGNSNVAAYLPTYPGQLNGVTINDGKYYGDGAGLTNLTGSAVTGTVPNANNAIRAATVTTAAQPAITSVGTLSSLNVAGNISTSGKFLGDGSGLTGISGPAFISTITIGQGLATSPLVPTEQPLIFNSVSQNIGNGYSAGIFTAPVAGFYQVSAACAVTPASWGQVLNYYGTALIGVYKNNIPIASGPFVDLKGLILPGNIVAAVISASSISSLIYLNVGDTLRCKLAYVTNAPTNYWNTYANGVPNYFQACWLRS